MHKDEVSRSCEQTCIESGHASDHHHHDDDGYVTLRSIHSNLLDQLRYGPLIFITDKMLQAMNIIRLRCCLYSESGL